MMFNIYDVVDEEVDFNIMNVIDEIIYVSILFLIN